MAARKITDEERKFMKTNVQSARWLKKRCSSVAILLRVARAIVARQQGFFTEGLSVLQPMGLRDIADEIEMHESTVSRSVAGKLADRQWSVFAERAFSSAIGRGGNGKTESAQAVKMRITELVKNETLPNGVLSDDELVACLRMKGWSWRAAPSPNIEICLIHHPHSAAEPPKSPSASGA